MLSNIWPMEIAGFRKIYLKQYINNLSLHVEAARQIKHVLAKCHSLEKCLQSPSSSKTLQNHFRKRIKWYKHVGKKTLALTTASGTRAYGTDCLITGFVGSL